MCDFSHCASNQEMITEKATKIILKFEKVDYINVDIFLQHLLNFFLSYIPGTEGGAKDTKIKR